ncbi:MAG: hypothetical protein ACOYBQ_06965 [Fluviibacter sp.]
MVFIIAAILIPPLLIYFAYKVFRFLVKGVEVTRANEKEDREWKAYQETHDLSDAKVPPTEKQSQ